MTDYYIRVSGSDAAAGTSAALAWASLNKALDTMGAGDTVYIGPGTYYHKDTARAAFGGTVGNPKVFQGDPYGLHTTDPAGPVIITSRQADYAWNYEDRLFEWTGDTKFWEFHDIVFLGGVIDNLDTGVFLLGSAVGAFGMDGIVFEDCLFWNKGANSRAASYAIYFNYGDGDTPSGNGVRIRRCMFQDPIGFLSDDNAVASFDIDVEIESCVFNGRAYIAWVPAAGTWNYEGLTIKNCTKVQCGVNTNIGLVQHTNFKKAGVLHTYGCLNDGNGKILNGNAGTAGASVAHYSVVTQTNQASIDTNCLVDTGMVYFNTGVSRQQLWGFEANHIYDKYFGTSPFKNWEPVAMFGQISPALAAGDPVTFPTLDYYNRPFQANHLGSRICVGFFNGDYVTLAPWSGVQYTWQDPDTVWSTEATINESTSDGAIVNTNGTISANFLHIEKPAVFIHASQVIHDVYVRVRVNMNDTFELGLNFYTLNEAEDLGGYSYTNDGLSNEHWTPFIKLDVPAGGWTKTLLENFEMRLWRVSGNANLYVRRVMVYVDGPNIDAGAVSAQGQREAETTVVNTGSNAIKFTRAGTYQTTVPVKASTEITISVYARKDSNYTGTGPKLAVFNIPGGTVEQTDTGVAAADTWEELTVTFTPTQSGFATLHLISQDTSKTGQSYFDTLTWT